jgi:hypothetical protein
VQGAGAAFTAGGWWGQGEFGILIIWHKHQLVIGQFCNLVIENLKAKPTAARRGHRVLRWSRNWG